MSAPEFNRGTQIAYIPNHAEGDIKHPDVQFGFVTSQNHLFVFCRYWFKGQEGVELRTRANSEGTDPANLVLHESCEQARVNRALQLIG